MPPTHIPSTSRALYRVFIAPTLRAPTSIPLLWAPAFASPQSIPPIAPSRTIIRTKTYKKDTARHALTDNYVIDNAIRSNHINFVDANNTYHPRMSIADALFRVNRATEYLVQMTPGTVDEFGKQDPNDLPTCRVWTKMALREHHERKLDLLRRQERGVGAGAPTKNLELNWAIAPGDLKHRLDRLRDFLADGTGRKVEVMFGPKKSGPAKTMKKATEEEAQAVVQAVRDAAAECKGAKEVKQEGTIGGILTLTFEGRREDQREVKEEKKESKKDRREKRREEKKEKRTDPTRTAEAAAS